MSKIFTYNNYNKIIIFSTQKTKIQKIKDNFYFIADQEFTDILYKINENFYFVEKVSLEKLKTVLNSEQELKKLNNSWLDNKKNINDKSCIDDILYLIWKELGFDTKILDTIKEKKNGFLLKIKKLKN